MANTGPDRKTQRHLTQNAEDKKRTTNTHPKSNRYSRGFCAHALREGVWGRHRGTNKTQKLAFHCRFGPPGVPQRKNTSYFTRVSEPTLVATSSFGTDFRRVSRSGAPLPARPQPQNTTDSWPQRGRVLGLVVGPPGPPRGCPERPRSPQRNAKHDGHRGFLKIY